LEREEVSRKWSEDGVAFAVALAYEREVEDNLEDFGRERRELIDLRTRRRSAGR
jgi:hypothetical protein